jgi:hypothetical protein
VNRASNPSSVSDAGDAGGGGPTLMTTVGATTPAGICLDAIRIATSRGPMRGPADWAIRDALETTAAHKTRHMSLY